MKDENLDACMKELAVLRKIDELPEYIQCMNIVQFAKAECLRSLSKVHELTDIDLKARSYSISTIAGLIYNVVHDNVFTNNDKILDSYATELLSKEGHTIEWYNRGTVLITQHKQEYMNKVRELKPSEAYLQLMHPFCGVQRDHNGDVYEISIY